MGTNSGNSIANLFLYASLGTSAISIPFGFEYFQPKLEMEYVQSQKLCFWDNDSNLTYCTYNIANEDIEYLTVLFDFSKKLLESSKDLENEYAEIVNRNFWDLI